MMEPEMAAVPYTQAQGSARSRVGMALSWHCIHSNVIWEQTYVSWVSQRLETKSKGGKQKGTSTHTSQVVLKP